jgi:hypothetical protein
VYLPDAASFDLVGYTGINQNRTAIADPDALGFAHQLNREITSLNGAPTPAPMAHC